MENPCILIPAYKPDEKMIQLIRQLRTAGFEQIIVVDDGSGPAFADWFTQAQDLGCVLLRHGINLGKGRALKTGMNYCLVSGLADRGLITADADGQHSPLDIAGIAQAMSANPDDLILGVRQFTGPVPLKSRLGNGITRFFFGLIHGSDVKDTQTGLRGLPGSSVPLFLSLPGERYEYEMNMLLAVRPHEIGLRQIPIETIYIESNRSSHFKVLQDSARIYWLLLKFVASSLTATAVDYLLFALMNISFPGQLIYSVVVARAVSSFINYSINSRLVFKNKNTPRAAIFRYYALAVAVMFASYGLIRLLSEVAGINLYVAKVMADGFLYFVSFFIQREFVYSGRKRRQN